MVLAASFSTQIESTDRFPSVFNGDLEHAFLQIEKHAFTGIEISLATPEEIKLNQLDRLLNQAKVKISAFSSNDIFERYDGSLVSENDALRSTTIERIKRIIDLASRYQVPVIIGKICGKSQSPENLGTKREKSYLEESLFELLGFASQRQVVLLFEVLNKDEAACGNTICDAAAIVRSFHSPFLRLAVNTCQLSQEILPVYDSLIASADVLAYIHLSDSDHKPLGKGEVEFFKIFRALDRIRYSGWLCVRSYPEPNAGVVLDAANFTVIKNAVALRCP